MSPMLGSLGNQPLIDSGSIVQSGFPVIASAAAIAPPGRFAEITGTVQVATITPPHAYFWGPLYLVFTDASPGATLTSGNIALATTVVRYKTLVMVYNPTTAKWYPSY